MHRQGFRNGIRLLLTLAVCAASSGVYAQNKAVLVPSGGMVPGQPQAVPPGAMPPGAGRVVELPAITTPDPERITLSAFAEPVQLTNLVELVARTLNVNVTIQGDLSGTVVFNAPVPIAKSELIPLLDSLLEQQGWTIVQNQYGFYTVQPQGAVSVQMAGDRATTRVFSTPNIRPSSLKTTIEGQLGTTQGQGGRVIAYIDDLGVIVATDTPRRLNALGTLVEAILAEYARSQFIRLELLNVAAPVARERALQLIGQMSQQTRVAIPGQEQVPQAQARAGALDNLGDRLTIDPQGNALIFRGLEEEIDVVRGILGVIDVPNTLVPKSYFAGESAGQIADIARSRGLGEVTTIQADRRSDPNFGFDFNAFQQQMQRANQTVGGPVMVVDQTRGTIIYYGTPAQHAQLDALIKELDTQSERVVIQAYKLAHSDAEKIAEIVNGILTNTAGGGEAPLLGGADSPRLRVGRRLNQPQAQPGQPTTGGGGGGGGGDGLELDGTEAFVIADTSNNQVIVKARQGQQKDFAKLIEKLDLRRPQVFIEARLIAVSWSDTMRLAFETQLINAGGQGGVINTNFGLGTFAAGGTVTGAKNIPAMGGLTAALIHSNYVPIIINALQTEADGRILSSPQLLVDDNEEAEIVSVDQEPTTTINRGNNQNDVITAGDYVEAGTKLKVKPQISSGGYLRLKYETELSSFTGTGSNGIPPPRQQNNIKSDSVTVPSDFTVVVGGFTLDNRRKTVVKVPLLGDIPLVGLLFQDRNTTDRKTSLYIFLTPRVLRDPNFADLKLLTQGPHTRSQLPADVPELSPVVIESGETAPGAR